MIQQTLQETLVSYGCATTHVTAGLTAAKTTPVLEYEAVWANTDAGQNPGNWPSTTYAPKLRLEANYMELIFLVAHASAPENKHYDCNIWVRGNIGQPIMRYSLTVTAGAAICGLNPVTQAALPTDIWHYADTILVNSYCNAYKEYDFTDGIATHQFDVIGGSYLFCDFDTDASAGDASDGICIGRSW